MKIAYFINQYPKVSHSFIRREIHALERLGFEVQRIALRGWDGPLPDEQDQAERQSTLYLLRKGARGLLGPTLTTAFKDPWRFAKSFTLALAMARRSDRSWPYHIAYLAEACRLNLMLSRAGVRHVHAHFGTNSAEVVMLGHALGGPTFSFTVHGPDEFTRNVHLREKVKRCEFAVAISSFTRSQLYLRCDYRDWPKIKVVHCGLEPHYFMPDESGFDDQPPHLVCVGRLSVEKGQLLLVEAAARIAKRGHDFRLALVGDGPARDEIGALIKMQGLEHRIELTGWLSSEDVRGHIRRARALILPSFAEGLPVVLMEAMALRRPVLCTYIAGIPELVHHGEHGWLIPAGSVDALEHAMVECLTTSVRDLARIGSAGFQRVMERHSSDTEAGKLAELFSSALGTHGSVRV